MNFAIQWIKRLLFGLIALIVLVIILALIFSSLVLLIPIVILLVAIGIVISLFRKAGKITKKEKKNYVDVEYRVQK